MLDVTAAIVQPETTWTDDRVEILKQLWADGMSCSLIAAELGVSRNAIIGKCHRLGLPKHETAKALPHWRHSTTAKASTPSAVQVRGDGGLVTKIKTRMRARKVVVEAPQKEPEPEALEDVIPIGQRCTLLELNDENCHWPVGDPGEPDFFFCGGKAETGMPYCGHHMRIAHSPRGLALAQRGGGRKRSVFVARKNWRTS